MSGVNEPTNDTKMIGRRRAAFIAVAMSLAVVGAGCSNDRPLASSGTNGPSPSSELRSTGGDPATQDTEVVAPPPATVAAASPRPVGGGPAPKAVPASGVAATRGSTLPGSARVTQKGNPAPSDLDATKKNLAEIDASLAEVDRELTTTNDEISATEGDPNQ